MQSKYITVFGAGCIGRGLLGQLAARAGVGVSFVEAVPEYAEKLAKAGSYTVRLVGRETVETVVGDYRMLTTDREHDIADALEGCAFAATAVGGPHLGSVAELIAPALRRRSPPLHLLVCENLPHADRVLADALREAGATDGSFSCVPVSVERMVRAAPDSLDLIGEAMESLYYDVTAWRGNRPEIPGLIAKDDLAPYYARKIFTNNAGHAVLAYEGYLAGYDALCDAHDDPAIRARVEALLQPSADMLALEFGLDRGELAEHVDTLLRYRFANRALGDTVRRVARNPLRKLGPEERLAGLLKRLQKHDLAIDPVCRAIAAAMHYRDPDDPECAQLEMMIREGGPETVLEKVAEIPPASKAFALCLEHYTAPFGAP